jgi:hypothetical protein
LERELRVFTPFRLPRPPPRLSVPARRARAAWDSGSAAALGGFFGFASAAVLFSCRATPNPPSASRDILFALLLSTLAWMSIGVGTAMLRNLYVRWRAKREFS